MSATQVQLDTDWLNEVDQSVHKIAKEFLVKLLVDDEAPGLHIEPMKNPYDKRVRTGRVNDFYRAILFKISSAAGSVYYVHRVLAHDDANKRAPQIKFQVNPVTGVPQFVALAESRPVLDSSSTPPSPKALKQDEKLSLLQTWGSSVSALVSELGFATDVAQLAMGCETQDDVIELAAKVTGLQSDMLLSLGAGIPISEVRKEFDLETAADFLDELTPKGTDEGPDLESDEAIIKATEHLLSKAQFTLIDGQDELENVISAGDFGAWRVFLHPTQRKYVEANFSGSARLSGGAGTGKTVVLLHRAVRLYKADANVKVVLTTFNATLASSLQDNLHLLDPSIKKSSLGQPGITVKGVDSLAYGVLSSANGEVLQNLSMSLLGREYSTKVSTKHAEAWTSAVDSLPEGTDVRIANIDFLQSEYESIVLPRHITTLDEYRKVRRPGRGIALDRKRRDAVWLAIKTYQQSAQGGLSYQERLSLAARYLLEPDVKSPVDHVLVDEGQDFSATHWCFVRALVDAGENDIFIAEDGNQRIYAEKIVLGHHGIKIVGRSRRLTLNYRTTQQNLKYAVGILEGAAYTDLEGEDVDSSAIISARFGPTPVLFQSQNSAEAVAKTGQVITEWMANDEGLQQSIAVLVTRETIAEKIAAALKASGVAAKTISRDVQPDPSVVQLMTMHRAKGMEFSRVVLFKQGAALGGEDVGSEPNSDEALKNRSLVYVAATRARDELVIVE